ncbi:MAG: cytidine deaminase [bacterium]
MEEDELIRLALEARENAHAPYSGFKVGAAILAKSGKVYTGSNVENISHGLALCAERSAVAAAVSAGERDFDTIVISSISSPPASPCGACRQVLREFSADMNVIMVNDRGERRIATLAGLLPQPFGGKDA